MLTRLFGWIGGAKSGSKDRPLDVHAIPTVKLDPAAVTDGVKAEVRAAISTLPEIKSTHHEKLYDAAIVSISRGRDLASLTTALLNMKIEGMTMRRAAEIARLLNDRATSVIDRQRQTSVGVSKAVWMYSGAPCMPNPKKPDDDQVRQDAA